jgi:hypothetical protein
MARRNPSAYQGDLFVSDLGTGYVAPPREAHGSHVRATQDRPVEATPAQPPGSDAALADIVMTELVRRLPKGSSSPYVAVLEATRDETAIRACLSCWDGGMADITLFDAPGEPTGFRYVGSLNEPWGRFMWRSGTKVWERIG